MRMKIKVYPTNSLSSDSQWFWHIRVNGRITASAHGYNTKEAATKAVCNHFVAVASMQSSLDHPQKKAIRDRVRFWIKVMA